MANRVIENNLAYFINSFILLIKQICKSIGLRFLYKQHDLLVKEFWKRNEIEMFQIIIHQRAMKIIFQREKGELLFVNLHLYLYSVGTCVVNCKS